MVCNLIFCIVVSKAINFEIRYPYIYNIFTDNAIHGYSYFQMYF